jgi:hypothetical protein
MNNQHSRDKSMDKIKALSVASTVMVSLAATVMLCACGNGTVGSTASSATQQLPSHMQSTEGRLDCAQGVVKTMEGFYYFCPIDSSAWLTLDNQHYAKLFAGQTVKMRGFFNYDSKSISIVSIQPVVAIDTKSANKLTVENIDR